MKAAKISPLSDNNLTALAIALGRVLVARLGQRHSEDYLITQLKRAETNANMFLGVADNLIGQEIIKRNTRVRVYEMFLDMLLLESREANHTPTIKNIFERTPNLAALIDKAFPGYIEASLFGLVIASLN